MTNKERILRHLEDYGSITSWEAIQEYGVTRLSAVIYSLRKEYIIEGEYLPSVNRYGENIYYKRYYLKGKK